jgi:ankyrin repeat protein
MPNNIKSLRQYLQGAHSVFADSSEMQSLITATTITSLVDHILKYRYLFLGIKMKSNWTPRIQWKIHISFLLLIFSIAAANCQPLDRKEITILTVKTLSGLPEMDKILKREYDVNIRGNEGVTPLMLAAMLDDAETIEELLNLGADLKIKDIRGNSALSKALDWNSISAIEKLINKGALDSVEISEKSSMGKMLQSASKIGSYEVVNYLLQNGVDVDFRDATGKTSLHMACTNGHIRVVEKLLSAGANIHLSDNSGLTSFHWAAPKASEEMIQLLLKNGADIYATTKSGATALSLAAPNAKALRLLLKYVKSPKTIIDENFIIDEVMDYKNSVELVSILLEHGGDPDKRRRGNILGTHLHDAIDSGEYEMAKQLINAGASMTTRNINGMTAIDLIKKVRRSTF